MPLYEYECKRCEKVHEVLQKMSDEPMTQCPDCNSAVERLMSTSAFIFKGAGFYTNDYKRKETAQKKSLAEGASGQAAPSLDAKAAPAPVAPAAASSSKE